MAELATACSDDPSIRRMSDELHRWVRWYRVPGYWLTFLFQLATREATSSYHVLACLLFYEAQVSLNDDFSVTSLETAYHSLAQIRQLGDNEELQRLSADLEGRLRVQHTFFATWCRPFDYMDCNPISEHMYSETTWRELRLEFPELQSESPPAPTTLLSVIEQCATPDTIYYRILARRRLGLVYGGQGQAELALEQFQKGLAEAIGVQLDAEIGHFHRLYGHTLHAMGNDAEAVREFERAARHEASPYCAYWQALSARELGDVRAFQLNRQGVDFARQPQLLEPARVAYHVGLQLFEAHLGAQPIPATRAVKQQMFRSFTGNALNVASVIGNAQDVIAEVEANGPRQVADVVAEMVAARDLPGDTPVEFQRAREVFHRHLTSIPDRFEDYLQSIEQDHDARQRYLHLRQQLTSKITSSQLSGDVATKTLALRLPSVVFILFEIGWRRSTIVLIDAGVGQILSDSVPLSEEQVRTWHDDYVQALRAAALRYDPAPSSADALDRLLARYEEALGPFLEPLMPFLRERHLKIFPRLHLNAVPFHALKIGGAPLIEQCTVSDGQTLGLFLNVHRDEFDSEERTLTMAWDDAGAPIFGGVSDSLGQRYGAGLTVLANPRWSDLASTLERRDATDLFFACHGEFNLDNPAASRLRLGDPAGITFSRVFADLNLRRCRSVTLGACESGLARAEIASEYVGLPSAFLAAGVRYVVGSLWKVNQLATAILLERYFSALVPSDRPIPAVLKAAQLEVMAMTRDDVRRWVQTHLPAVSPRIDPLIDRLEDRPYAHPLFWAGMYVSGDV